MEAREQLRQKINGKCVSSGTAVSAIGRLIKPDFEQRYEETGLDRMNTNEDADLKPRYFKPELGVKEERSRRAFQ